MAVEVVVACPARLRVDNSDSPVNHDRTSARTCTRTHTHIRAHTRARPGNTCARTLSLRLQDIQPIQAAQSLERVYGPSKDLPAGFGNKFKDTAGILAGTPS